MENKPLKEYEIAAIQLKTLFDSTGIAASRTNPHFTIAPWNNTDKKPWPRFEYEFTFTKGKASIGVPYSCGADQEEEDPYNWHYNKTGGNLKRRSLMKPTPKASKLPKACEVFGRICSDGLEAHEASFEEWASNFGYDTDSRSAEKIYHTCVKGYFDASTLVNIDTMRKFAELSNQL